MGVLQESAVRPVAAVGRLSGRRGEQLLHPLQIQMEEQGTVEEENVPLSALGVAGNFHGSQRQVGVALDGDRLAQQRLERPAMALQDKAVRLADGLKRGARLDAEDQRVIQAAGTLEDRSAAGTAAQDGDPGSAAIGLPDVPLKRVPVA